MAGRRPISSERASAILTGLEMGMTRRAAAGAADIAVSTFYDMLKDPMFSEAVEKAESRAEARYTAIVMRAAEEPKNWTAAAWWLERRKHLDYGRKDRVDLSIDVRKEAERVAIEKGLDPDAIMARVDEILGVKP